MKADTWGSPQQGDHTALWEQDAQAAWQMANQRVDELVGNMMNRPPGTVPKPPAAQLSDWQQRDPTYWQQAMAKTLASPGITQGGAMLALLKHDSAMQRRHSNGSG